VNVPYALTGQGDAPRESSKAAAMLTLHGGAAEERNLVQRRIDKPMFGVLRRWDRYDPSPA
jgi:hypothetical protein